MEKIHIKNGEKINCPFCRKAFMIKNDSEIMIRNVTISHFNPEKNILKCICKQCKNEIEEPLSDHMRVDIV